MSVVTGPPRFPPRILLALTLGLAAGLRFALIGHNSVWVDEVFVVKVAALTWRDVLPYLRAVDTHPPLYYLLMKAWIGIAGRGEVAIRLPSACFSVLTVALTYALMRRISSEGGGLLSAFLVSVSPLEIMAGQEARMYALLGTLVLASTLALLASVERGGGARWVVYALLAALTAYTQYLGIFVVLAHGIWVAWYERTCLWRWLASAGGAGALYAPWAPSLWYQTIHASHWIWPTYSHRIIFLDLGDLFGLFAFGGSLFGMGGYFFGGTLGPVQQLAILLPFLILLWRGVISFGSDRRLLALLWLPPAVTIGVMVLLAFSSASFFPRWFTFLLPFYAMTLARGILDVADHFPRHQHRVRVLLVSGLLLFSVPVLGRYYFDPNFRPYQWRAAAHLVERQVRHGDVFFFVGNTTKDAFSYYFQGQVREPYPALVLFPQENLPEPDRLAGFADTQVQRVARRYARGWLITPTLGGPAHLRLEQALGKAFRFASPHDFGGVFVYLLEAAPQSQAR